ncbi:MAG: homogentisate 1,2-dioxygenase [Myxococcota bacterium]|nr:homogentisate 1,2-dioxygenase [Myxococcota bacterium]
MPDALRYLSGFGNTLSSEAEPDTLPRRQNTPQHAALGLFTEQLNGTGFTVRRSENQRVWLYRLRPQILDRGWRRRDGGRLVGQFHNGIPSPEVMRFRPVPLPETPTDFLAGLTTFAGAGDPSTRRGAAIHLYAASADMTDAAFANIDGDLLVAPQHGALLVRTELGRLHVAPGEILIIPRGIRFQVLLPDGPSRGFVSELFDGHFQLPERGPIGANGMADERHFLAPVADYEDITTPWTIIVKQGGLLWEQTADHSPFDVVAWQGTYAPFKYDLRNFNSMGSVSFDHPDPSILTVLTCPMDDHGRNAVDVGVFIGRWDPTEHTFRPPYFHRNSAIEFNAVISSPATSGPWQPGAFSWTPYLTPHGVSSRGHAGELDRTDGVPSRGSDEAIWLQFESTYPLKVMPWMIDHDSRDGDYLRQFSGWQTGVLVR